MALEVFVDSNLVCFGDPGLITICGCDGGQITIEAVQSPDAAPEPDYEDQGNNTWLITPSVRGPYQFKAVCCGND